MHDEMPKVVPIAVRIVISVWMMIFQVSFFMSNFRFQISNFKFQILNQIVPGLSVPSSSVVAEPSS